MRGKVDHAVFVDVRRGLVWDSEEDCPIDLNSDSLWLCAEFKSRKV